MEKARLFIALDAEDFVVDSLIEATNKLRKVIRYKHRDAIVVEGKNLTMRFHLKYKIEDLRWEDIEDFLPRGEK